MSYGSAAANANKELNSLFEVEIDGISVMAFETFKLDDSEWGEMDARAGADDLFIPTDSGLRKTHKMTVTKHLRVGGWADIKSFWDWYEKGSTDRKDGAIVIKNRDGGEAGRITFKEGWVQKASFPEHDANNEAEALPYAFTITARELKME